MKKVFALFMVAFTMVTVSSYAQPGGDRMAQQQERQKAFLKDSVGLTDEQLTKYEALNKEYQPKLMAIRQDESLDRDAKMAKAKALNDEKTEKAKKFLTAEQVEKINAKQKAMMRGGFGGGGPRGDKAPKAADKK